VISSNATTPQGITQGLEALKQRYAPVIAPNDATGMLAKPDAARQPMRTFTPAGSPLLIDTETGEASLANAQGVMARLREMRDEVVLNRMANNPLQKMAATILTPIANALTRSGKMGAVENIAKGLAVGSLLIPDDAAIDPASPNGALQLAGMFVGAGVEGAAADLGVLSSLTKVKAIATARGAPNLVASADEALRAFGAGEDLTAMQRAMGGAKLGAASEVGLRIASGEFNDPLDILAASGVVAISGATLGGAIASTGTGVRATVAGARAAVTFAESMADPAAALIKQMEVAKIVAVADPTATVMSATRALEREGADAAEMIKDAMGMTGSDSFDGALKNPNVEAIFEQPEPRTFLQRLSTAWGTAHETFTNSFIYEAKLQHLPDPLGNPELNMADRMRELKHSISRASALAEKDLKYVTEPLLTLRPQGMAAGAKALLQGEYAPFKVAYAAFERLVVLRDLTETASRGLKLPGGLTLGDVQAELRLLENAAAPEAITAANRHRLLVGSIREDLVRRGRLGAEDGYNDYYPHQILQDLADDDAAITGSIRDFAFPTTSAMERGKLREPRRGYTKHRSGSEKRINTNYVQTMFRAVRRVHADNAVEDFLKDASKLAIDPKTLNAATKAEIKKRPVVINGEVYKRFRPKGPGYYRTSAVSDDAFDALVEAIESGGVVDLDAIPALRNVVALGKPKEYILPAALADRLELFSTPDPLHLNPTLLNAPVRFTQWWKRNTIWWGLSKFFVFQILGDSTNLLRSNPAAFLQLRDGGLDSPALRAINEVANQYGMPLMSKPQAIGLLGGTALGATASAVADEDAQHSLMWGAGGVLLGATLGYIGGSRAALRTGGLAKPFGSSIYELADELGVINSGYVANEETLARRILGSPAGYIGQPESLSVRALDTVKTLLSGKAHGDPFAFARVPAEIVEGIQTERENVLRLASFMQMVETGMDSRVAAKRARESLVDYGRFTDFEDRFLRGFGLPFYAFYRHNIPNWIKAAAGRDVGGKAAVALTATAGLAAADVAVQAWNETFFPEVEQSIRDFRREQFHIILGNALTGEPYRDRKGNPMIVGWEMPYEQALEFFGLARPGEMYSRLFGLAGMREGSVSLVDAAARTGADVVQLKGIRDYTLGLLNPIIKEPIQLFAANKDFFLNEPIVPERYVGTSVGHDKMLEHAARTFFRQYREARRASQDTSAKRFDPLISAFGLGLPVTSVSIDRDLQGYLHERIDLTTARAQQTDALWRKPIDDILYERKDLAAIGSEEHLAVWEMLHNKVADRNTLERAWRYYGNRVSQSTLERRFKAMSTQDKVAYWNSLPDFAKTAFVFYMNGGTMIEQSAGGFGAPGPF